MSKGNRRPKRVPVTLASSYSTIDFKQAWAEARMQDSTLSPTHPKNLPEEVERAILVLAKRVLQLESEWS